MAYINKKFVHGRTIEVNSNDLNDVNRAISMLRHMSAPIIKELKTKRYFEKPCQKRRRKEKESLRKTAKRQRILEQLNQ